MARTAVRMTWPHLCFCASLSWGLLYAAIAAGGDANIGIDAVLDLLRAREAVAERYAWDFDFVGLKGPRPDVASGKSIDQLLQTAIAAGTRNVKEDDPYRTKGHALYEVETGRFRLEVESITKWVDGAAPAISKRVAWGFDGSIFTELSRQRHGTELPPHDVDANQATDTALGPQVGEIKAGALDKDTLSSYFKCSGLSFLPPFVELFESTERPVRITERLQQKRTSGNLLGVDERPAGLWTIRIRQSGDVASHADVVRITIDSMRGGIITTISWHTKEDWPPFQQIDVRPREWKAGIWGPEEVTYFNWLNGIGSRLTVSRFETDPPVKDDDFVIDMPPGTTVRDHVREMSYVASGSSLDQAKAIREYVRTYKLDKIPATEFDEDAPANRSTSRYVALLIANAAIVGFVVLLYFLRRKRRGPLTVFLAGVLLSQPVPSSAGTVDADGESVEYHDGWRIRSGSGARVRISQCGYNVALLALSLFDTNFDPIVVDRELKPGVDGIRMSALKSVIEAHGLNVSARAEVPLRELIRLLGRGQLAILAVNPTASPTLHYVVACRAQSGDVLLLDPPGRVDNLSRWTNAQLEQYGRMTILICSCNSKRVPLSSRLELSPDVVILQAATDAPEESIAVNVLLQNTTNEPLAITGVKTPCGCIRVNWNGGVIPGRGKLNIQINVLRNRWGVGQQAKAIEFSFADWTSARLPIQGELISAGAAAAISSGTRVIHVPMECGQSQFRRTEWIDLENEDSIASMTDVSSSEKWCTKSVNEQSGIRRLQLDVVLGRAHLQQLSDGEPLRAQIRSPQRFVGDEFRPIDWNVVVSRDVSASITPRVLVLKDGAGSCNLTVGSGVSDEWRPTAVLCANRKLQFEWSPVGSRMWEIRCTRQGDESRPAVAKCVLEKGGEFPVQVNFVVTAASLARSDNR